VVLFAGSERSNSLTLRLSRQTWVKCFSDSPLIAILAILMVFLPAHTHANTPDPLWIPGTYGASFGTDPSTWLLEQDGLNGVGAIKGMHPILHLLPRSFFMPDPVNDRGVRMNRYLRGPPLRARGTAIPTTVMPYPSRVVAALARDDTSSDPQRQRVHLECGAMAVIRSPPVKEGRGQRGHLAHAPGLSSGQSGRSAGRGREVENFQVERIPPRTVKKAAGKN